MAVTYVSMMGQPITHFGGNGGRKVNFQIGDKVRAGMHVGTVTDVGSILVQIETNEGRPRVVCSWELVRIPGSHDGVGFPAASR
jgi:hypothetical protein